MKKCQNCNYENAETMRFCLECGTPLPEEGGVGAPIVVNLAGDKPTESLGGAAPPTNFGAPPRETETFSAGRADVGRNFGNFSPPLPSQTPRPKSNKKLFLILGGLASLLALLGVAGAAIGYYNFCCQPPPPAPRLASTSPTPSAAPDKTKSPTPKTSPTASPSATVDDDDAPKPQAAFTPPIEPTRKGTFTVSANEGWQLSDIDVVSLEEFRTSVQGAIDLAGIKASVTAAGVSDAKTKARRIYPEFPTGALLMRTRFADGKTSNTVSMTTNGANGSWQNYPNETGKLEFCVNDNAPENNGGQFIVTKTTTASGAAKGKTKKN